MKTFIPVLWGALAVALTALINEQFSTAIWGPVALSAIIMVGNWVAVKWPKPPPSGGPAGAMGAAAPPEKPRGDLKRWLIG